MSKCLNFKHIRKMLKAKLKLFLNYKIIQNNLTMTLSNKKNYLICKRKTYNYFCHEIKIDI